MTNKHPIEPLPLGGFVAGMDFGHPPHGTIQIQVDEAFSSALGKRARVLIVPDESEYFAAHAIADALEALLGSLNDDPAKDTTVEAQARAALRAAGRLP